LVCTPDGGTTTAKIGAFLDHHTRYPVADRYYLSEKIATLRDTMLRAFLKWGTPRVVYVDNGSVYRSKTLEYSLKKIGCELVHSRAYYSQGRGLIEKWWQVLLQFEDEVRARDELLTIHELNSLWEAYRELRYCQDTHTELGRSPAEAIAEVTPKPIDPGITRLLFLCKEVRTVNKKDGCVRVLNHPFLCESFLRGRKVDVLYDPNDLSSVEIELDNERVHTAFPQPINAAPEPHAEEAPERPAQSVDYLMLLREDYDKQLLEHARPLAYAQLELTDDFDEQQYLGVFKELAGLKKLSPAQQRELRQHWKTWGPLPEDLVRIAVEHAVRLHGRGRHVQIYIHAVRTLVLAHWRGGPNQEKA
jgi:putative transposase